MQDCSAEAGIKGALFHRHGYHRCNKLGALNAPVSVHLRGPTDYQRLR